MIYFIECKKCDKRITSDSPNITDIKYNDNEEQYFIDYANWENQWFEEIEAFESDHQSCEV